MSPPETPTTPPPDERPGDARAGDPAPPTATADEAGAPADAAAGSEPEAPAGAGLRRWMPRRRPAAAGEPTGDAAEEPPAAAAPPAEAPGDDAPAAGTEPRPADDAGEATTRPRRFLRRRARPSAPDAAAPGSDGPAAGDDTPPVDAADTEGSPGRLRRRRKRLIDEREIAVYHLGGLAFELYRRDLLAEEVLRLRAGQIALLDETIHDIDTRLEQLDADRRERRARRGVREPEPAGNCLTCRAPFYPDARFCFQCGSRLAPNDAEMDEQITQAIAARRA